MPFRISLNKSWIRWLAKITEPDTYSESCAWLFCDKPFHDDHTIFVFPVKNVGRKNRSIYSSFAPDKEDFQRVKAEAKEKHLIRLGTVHTHIAVSTYITDHITNQNRHLEELLTLDPSELEHLYEASMPSKIDLQFARRFNDIIRGIVTVYFAKPNHIGQVYSVLWHNQFGDILEQKVCKNIEQGGLEIAVL